MGLFDKMFGSTNTPANSSEEQAVIIKFNYGINGLEALYELEDKLEEVIDQNGVGEYDGHEIAVDYIDGYLYMYGHNAEILFKAIRSTLDNTDFMKGAVATLRFGPPGDNTKQIDITL